MLCVESAHLFFNIIQNVILLIWSQSNKATPASGTCKSTEPTVLRFGWSISDSFPRSLDAEETGKEEETQQFPKFHKIDIIFLKCLKKWRDLQISQKSWMCLCNRVVSATSSVLWCSHAPLAHLHICQVILRVHGWLNGPSLQECWPAQTPTMKENPYFSVSGPERTRPTQQPRKLQHSRCFLLFFYF